ncbi:MULTISPECIES: twin-arginine translocase TatA/TatE family subunit [Novosphingobium]|uniref:Sec-independent protein translocase protein TatA n=1 Tax=Novosphingobium sediminicola TaxID=563162 RepID=A0A7W6CFF8_9SPHN|nr:MULTISPECIES: twin-arginine translocase TatA/TatE family subunit [Novosphingobium]MBB3954857.1 sec-independent protein translocase protein TatA [Novosphingobium sediminicola]NOW47217.1 sec-independent protein translocase protein TatA [Novosphingobium sp. SG751A]
MGFGSVWHWVIVLLVVLVLFGRGRVSDIMGDFGKGIKSFKEGMADETTDRPVTPPAQIEGKGEPVKPAATEEKTGQN